MGLSLAGLTVRPRHLLWLAATAAAIGLSLPSLTIADQSSPNRLDYFAEDFTNGSQVITGSTQVEGFHPGIYGWNLAPGAHGRLAYTIHKKRGDDLAVDLWFYTSPDIALSGDVSVRLDDGSPGALDHNPRYVGNLLALPSGTQNAQSVEIDLGATNNGTADQLVVDRLTWSTVSPGPPFPAPRWSSWALGAVIGLFALPLIHHRRRFWIAVALALLVGAAADLRLGAVVLAAHVYPANPDTVAYQAWADRFQWWPPERGLFCGCYGPREPIWISIGSLLTQLLGSSSTYHLRAASAMLSIADVVLAVVAARRRLGWVASLAVGALLALNGIVVSNATRGLRTELELTLCLLLYLLLDRKASRRPYLEATLAGVLGAALALTRTFFLPVVIAVEAISILVRRRPLRHAAVLLLIAASLPVAGTVAHRVGLYQQPMEYGLIRDPFLDTDSYARWNANTEKFELGRPMPHPELFPTRAEYDKYGPYFGPKITYTQYLFELHSPSELVGFSLAGYVDVIRSTAGFLSLAPESLVGDPSVLGADPSFGAGRLVDNAVRVLGLLGLLWMVLAGRRRPLLLLVPAMYVGILGFAVFLYHLGLIERYYNVIQAWPFFYIGSAWFVEQVVAAGRRDEIRKQAAQLGAQLRNAPRTLLRAPRRADLALPALAIPFALGLVFSLPAHSPRPNGAGLEFSLLVVLTAGLIALSRLPSLPNLARVVRWGCLGVLVEVLLSVPIDRIARGQLPGAAGALVLLLGSAWLTRRGSGWERLERLALLAAAAPLCLVAGVLAGVPGVVSVVALAGFSLAPNPGDPARQLEASKGEQGHRDEEEAMLGNAHLGHARDSTSVADRDLQDRKSETGSPKE
jgi:hypothetical protein